MQCQQTLLAQQSHQTFISYCQHGTIFLHWRRVAIYFDYASFKKIVAVMEEPSQELRPQINRLQADDGSIELWMGDVALWLKPVDYLLLLDTMREALRNMPDHIKDFELPSTVESFDLPHSPGSLFNPN